MAKESSLSPAAQEFLKELRTQMSPDVLMLFDSVLAQLEKPSAAEQKQLQFLQALLDEGVDNWHGYENALDAVGLGEEDDD